jgi:hypothetical protein
MMLKNHLPHPLNPSARETRLLLMYRSRLIKVLNVPQRMHFLQFRLACGLAEQPFDQPAGVFSCFGTWLNDRNTVLLSVVSPQPSAGEWEGCYFRMPSSPHLLPYARPKGGYNTATGAALPLLNYMNPRSEYSPTFLGRPSMSG